MDHPRRHISPILVRTNDNRTYFPPQLGTPDLALQQRALPVLPTSDKAEAVLPGQKSQRKHTRNSADVR